MANLTGSFGQQPFAASGTPASSNNLAFNNNYNPNQIAAAPANFNPGGTIQGATSAGTPNVGSSKGSASGMPTVGFSPLPNQQIAPLTNQQLQGMGLVSSLTPGALDYLGTTVAQAGQIGGIGTGAIGGQNTLANQYQTSGAPMAGNIMSGGLLDPQTNQYLQQYFNAASQPLTQQFQQTTAPNILQTAAQTGTLGSAGTSQGFQNAENALAEGLGNLAAGIYEPAYATNLAATTNLLGQGLNTASGIYGQQLQAAQNAQNMAPSLTGAMYGIPQQLLNTGQIGQNQGQNVLNAAYQNLNQQAQWPYNALSMLFNGIGSAGGQQGTTVGSSTGGGTA